MPKQKIPRQLRWEVRSRDRPEAHEYAILIINQRRETSQILQRASEHFMPADEPTTIAEGNISGTGLKFKLVTITAYRTPPNQVDWRKIYKGQVTRDRNLSPRETPDGLANYVINAIGKGTFS
ncbi:MAG: hypothetical protein KJ718_03105 [Nanoarchaeota archaeon]|nr:hypothetical protein [Nanoarchaeota archaeon]MBU1051518.1 hypothetical protein [Nanoarchaeota archaeon]MBU1988966.1 hypothetical protein [Nanoarchaeota archaeon]